MNELFLLPSDFKNGEIRFSVLKVEICLNVEILQELNLIVFAYRLYFVLLPLLLDFMFILHT